MGSRIGECAVAVGTRCSQVVRIEPVPPLSCGDDVIELGGANGAARESDTTAVAVSCVDGETCWSVWGGEGWWPTMMWFGGHTLS